MGGQGAAAEPHGHRLPILVAAACTALAALLFATSTVPALREGEDLRRMERRTRAELLDLLTRTRELRERRLALDWDPQTLLVEIDRLGLLPEELLAEQAAPR
jgi:hypothetical protein